MTSFLWLPCFRKAHGFASTCFSTNTTNHYAAGTHHLELLRPGESAAEVVRYLNGQCWFGDAAVLIDAGYVCQTFCFVATWLGLAPFCTMALPDSR
jgi:hypothetical protein